MAKKVSQRNTQQPDALEEVAHEGMEILKTYQGPLTIAIIIGLAGVMFMSYKTRNEKRARLAAWTALHELEVKARKNDRAKDEDKKEISFKPLVEKHRGTDMAKFAMLREVDRLYKKGEKADLQSALEMLQTFKKRRLAKGLYDGLIEQKIANISAELAHAPSWAPKKEEKKDEEADASDKPADEKGPEKND